MLWHGFMARFVLVRSGWVWHGKVLLERFRYGLLRKAEAGLGEVGFSQ